MIRIFIKNLSHRKFLLTIHFFALFFLTISDHQEKNSITFLAIAAAFFFITVMRQTKPSDDKNYQKTSTEPGLSHKQRAVKLN